LSGEPLIDWELRRRRRDGSELRVAASVSLIRGHDGAPQALSLIERDITPRMRAEAQLRESEQRFRTLANTAPVLIWMAETDGRLVFANQEFTQFVGMPADHLAKHSLRDWLHRDDAARVMAALSVLGPGDRFDGKVRMAHRDGVHRWVQCSAMLQADTAPRRSMLVGSMVDVDAQVRAEESVRDANRHKDEFLAMLGHELRNPLAPIRNAAEVLRRVGAGDEQLTWVHGVLVRQTSHVTRLVDDLLDISLITRGTMQLRLEPVDLLPLLRRAVDDVMPMFRRKRHQLKVSLPQEPLWVEADQIRLRQVFDNLLNNAAKYTDDGGRVELLAKAGPGFVSISVCDNGLGLSAQMQTRAFDLFVQDPRSIDRSQGGLGIGLALARHLVGMHGGSIEARSAGLGLGSEFEVRLPRLDKAPAREPALERGAAGAANGRGRVLVVDDDVEGGESLKVLLELSGFEVASATDLDSALAAAATLRPHVVVTDIAMPGADGYEVARRLRAQADGHAMAVMSMSGYGRPRDHERAKSEGFAHHFVKPIEPDELDRVLRETIRGLDRSA
jgi:PAS domain S-box-containing protein